MKPKARTNEIILKQLKDETLVYDLKTNRALCLNETLAMVWEHCDGFKSVDDIRIILENQLKAKVDNDLIILALDQLRSNDLLENEETTSGLFEGMSRREVIRKVGLTAMITLPMISIVTAPSAASAQSGACVPRFCECPAGTPVGTTCGQGNFFGQCVAPCLCTAFVANPAASFGECFR
jgi:hypothetical protein